MAEVTSWWQDIYPQFSLASLSDLPVYQRMRGLDPPFIHATDEVTENFTVDEQVEDYTSRDTQAQTYVRLIHRIGTENWTYERHYLDQGSEVKAVTQLSQEGENGQVERSYFDHKTVEVWEKGETLKYQKTVHSGDTVLILNSGRDGDQCGWSEVSFTSPTMHESERIHTAPNSQSGETNHIYGNFSWGSIWRKSPFFEETKNWRKAGSRTWSQTHGTACEKMWDDRLELSPAARKEDRLLQDGPRYRGFKLHRAGDDYVKLEWEGDRPDTPCKGIIALKSDASENLKNAVEKEKQNLVESLGTLKLMTEMEPEYEPEVSPLQEAVKTEVLGDDPSVEKLLRLQDLQTQVEALKKRLEEHRKVTIGKYEAIEKPLRELAQGALATFSKPPNDTDPTILGFNTEALSILSSPAIPLTRIKSWIDLLQRICRFSHTHRRTTDSEPVQDLTIDEIWTNENTAVELVSPEILEKEDFERENVNGKLELILRKSRVLVELLQRRGQSVEIPFNPPRPSATESLPLSTIPEDTELSETILDSELSPSLRTLLLRLNTRLRDISLRLLQVVAISHPTDLAPVERLEAALKQGEFQPVLQSLWTRSLRVEEVGDMMGRYWDAVYRAILLLDKLLSKTLKETKTVLQELNLPGEIQQETIEIAAKTVRKDGEDVLIQKARQLHKNTLAIKAGERSLSDVVEELTLSNDELDQLLRQKSDEIVFLTKEMDKKEKKLRERQEELLMLRKYKAVQEDNSEALKDALIQLRESELSSKPSILECATCLDIDARKVFSLHYILSLLRKRRNLNQASLLSEWYGTTQSDQFEDMDLEALGDVGDTKCPPVMEAEYLTEVDAREIEKADLPLAKERVNLVKRNEIVRGAQYVKLAFKSPLSNYDFYKLIESCFRDKVNEDNESLFTHIRPPDFPSYMLHHSIHVMGTKEKGLQQIALVALTLGRLYKEKEPYAGVIARVMRLCDPHPATLEGELLALQYWQRLSYSREIPNNCFSHGGYLPLISILDTYYPDFQQDPTVSQIWLNRIRPSTLPYDQYGLHLLTWRLRNLNKTPDEVFGYMSSPFQRSDFAGTIKDRLELHLPKAVFGALWSLLRGKAALTVPTLQNELPTEECEDTITVANFLHGILDGHEAKRKRHARHILRAMTSPVFSDTFSDFYRTLDPQASEEWIGDLVEQLREAAPSGPFDKDNIVQVLATHPPKPMRTPVLYIERLHENLKSYHFSTSLDTLLLDTPVQRVRLIRTTETVLTTSRRHLSFRRLLQALEDDEDCMCQDRINFRLNYLGNRGLQAVLVLLGVNSRLKYLNLSRQGIHNSGAQNLAMTFYRHPSLANLDLSYNRIATVGGKALQTLAEENEPLLMMDITHNDMDFRLQAKIEEIIVRKQRGTSRLTSVQTHSQVFENNIPTEMDETESLAPPAFTPAESSQSLLSSRAISQAGEPVYASFPRRPPRPEHRF